MNLNKFRPHLEVFIDVSFLIKTKMKTDKTDFYSVVTDF